MAAAQRIAAPHTTTQPRVTQERHEFNGEEFWIEVRDEVVPDPPPDWDRTSLLGAIAMATALSLFALGWSTYSIGMRLHAVAHAAVAFPAASAFTLAWVACLLLEWHARHDPDKVKLPRAAGWVAVVIAMVAVATHGWQTGNPAAGAIGAGVDLIAKGLWVLVIHLSTIPMDDRTRQCVKQIEARSAGRVATLPTLLAAARREARFQATMAWLGQPVAPASGGTLQPTLPAPAVPAPPPLPAPAAVPAPAPVPLAPPAPAPVPVPLPPPAPAGTNEPAPVIHQDLPPGSPTSAVVRKCVEHGVVDLDAVLGLVRIINPDAKEGTVSRALRREINSPAPQSDAR